MKRNEITHNHFSINALLNIERVKKVHFKYKHGMPYRLLYGRYKLINSKTHVGGKKWRDRKTEIKKKQHKTVFCKAFDIRQQSNVLKNGFKVMRAAKAHLYRLRVLFEISN